MYRSTELVGNRACASPPVSYEKRQLKIHAERERERENL